MRFHVYMTEEDERPLLAFLASTGGRIIHLFAREWPPLPMTTPPKTCGEDECLAIWYPDVFSQAEMMLPECHPEKGPHGCFDAWDLPFITFQRMWYWKKQGTIFAVEMDYRAFRPNRPEEQAFPSEEMADFENRLMLLKKHAAEIEQWCQANLRSGHIGDGAWQESEELRRYG